MPVKFDDARVERYLEITGCDTGGTPEERRLRAAEKSEELGDAVQAWEIRTGRPWNEMTSEEARELVDAHPRLLLNPGILTRLHVGGGSEARGEAT